MTSYIITIRLTSLRILVIRYLCSLSKGANHQFPLFKYHSCVLSSRIHCIQPPNALLALQRQNLTIAKKNHKLFGAQITLTTQRTSSITKTKRILCYCNLKKIQKILKISQGHGSLAVLSKINSVYKSTFNLTKLLKSKSIALSSSSLYRLLILKNPQIK